MWWFVVMVFMASTASVRVCGGSGGDNDGCHSDRGSGGNGGGGGEYEGGLAILLAMKRHTIGGGKHCR